MKESVLTTWFAPIDAHRLADDAHRTQWVRKDPAFDETLRQTFAPLYEEIAGGHLETWLETPRGRLAYFIVIDQFARNMFRDTANMYAADQQAEQACRNAITNQSRKSLATDEEVFLYMPLMHSEDISAQDLAITQFSDLAYRCPPEARARC